MHRGYRIAVIESDELIRQLVERWLTDAGHSVLVRTPSSLRPGDVLDLVLANVANPRAAAGPLRALQALNAAPVLLVSARIRRGLAPSSRLAAQLGVRGVLPKPFTRDELLAAVEAALNDSL
ncbi:MAG TPA: hypothetical protein VLA16_18575 [Ideonella sp.]|nr:hypothetical protein [Ideonella sp.]